LERSFLGKIKLIAESGRSAVWAVLLNNGMEPGGQNSLCFSYGDFKFSNILLKISLRG
jgi:hypothetical protein